MRKITIFFLGFCVGILICVMLMFAFGILMSQFSIQLYGSEFEQQRNFNFFVIISLIMGLISGAFTLKRFSR